MRHTRPLSLSGIVAMCAAGAFVLAGCAAPPAAVDPETTATPSPTVEPVALPEPLVDATCDELAPIALVQGALSAETVPAATRPPEFENYFPLPDSSLEQAGGISCVWSNGSEYGLGMLIEVLPNAASEWERALPQLLQIDDNAEQFGVLSNSFGDSSTTNCASYDVGEGFYGNCFYDILVGDYWASVHIEAEHYYEPEEPQAQFAVQILESVAAVLATLESPEPTWRPAEDSFAPDRCDSLVSLELMRTATADPSLVEDLSVPPLTAQGDATARVAGTLRCKWSGATPDVYSQADIVVQPGGAWAWDGSAPPATLLEGELARIDGLGDAAWGGCETPPRTNCEIDMLINDSWVVIHAAQGDVAALMPVASALVAAAS
jgi:hypothetical protein